jgi:hypothetical protein
MEKLPFNFMPTMTKLTKLPALTKVHLTFSQTRVPQEIGQEFNICGERGKKREKNENRPYTDSGCGMKINLILTLERRFIKMFLCPSIF